MQVPTLASVSSTCGRAILCLPGAQHPPLGAGGAGEGQGLPLPLLLSRTSRLSQS